MNVLKIRSLHLQLLFLTVFGEWNRDMEAFVICVNFHQCEAVREKKDFHSSKKAKKKLVEQHRQIISCGLLYWQFTYCTVHADPGKSKNAPAIKLSLGSPLSIRARDISQTFYSNSKIFRQLPQLKLCERLEIMFRLFYI